MTTILNMFLVAGFVAVAIRGKTNYYSITNTISILNCNVSGVDSFKASDYHLIDQPVRLLNFLNIYLIVSRLFLILLFDAKFVNLFRLDFKMSWTQAADTCKRMNFGYLLTLESLEEFMFLIPLMPAALGNQFKKFTKLTT